MASFLERGGIALFAVSLLWWAMFVEHLTLAQRVHNVGGGVLHLLGLFVALAAVIGPSIPSMLQGNGLPATVINIGLVIWLWRRGIYRVRSGFDYAELVTSFKRAFGILLFILLLALLIPQGQMILDTLVGVFSLFFLCGLTALSLARLGALRTARHRLDGSQADPTRVWLLALTILGCGIGIMVSILESIFSFTSFELTFHALTPLWDALGTLVGWIFYAIILIVLTPLFALFSFLFGLLSHNTAAQPQHAVSSSPFSHLQQGPQAISPEILTLGRWAFLILACGIVLLIVRASLRQWWMRSNDAEIEEVREGLDARSFLRDRWREWWNSHRQRRNLLSLEPLDPASVRAHYREFLQSLAKADKNLARLPAETADEYAARLLPYLERGDVPLRDLKQNHHDTMAEDSILLDELTHAYTAERYGGRETSDDQRAHLRAWVTRLVTRLTGKTRTGSFLRH